jgi:hypothetical protein
VRFVQACLATLLVAALAAAPTLGATRAADTGAHSRGGAASATNAAPKALERKAVKGRAARSEGKRRTASGFRAGAAETSHTSTTPPLRVLFIGNSHTDRHGGMDWLVRNLAASDDPPRSIVTERLVASGVTLEYHVRNGALKRIRDGDWDIVVLQEYLPGIPTQSAEPFLTHARLLDMAIRDAGARTVLYMTWPERLRTWASLDDIEEAHRQLAIELGAAVAPVGMAMDRARQERPELSFLDWDGVHTTWDGAYLAAATIYAAVFGQSPEGLPYHLGLSDDDASFLQRIAWETVSDWRADSRLAAASATASVSDTPGDATG